MYLLCYRNGVVVRRPGSSVFIGRYRTEKFDCVRKLLLVRVRKQEGLAAPFRLTTVRYAGGTGGTLSADKGVFPGACWFSRPNRVCCLLLLLPGTCKYRGTGGRTTQKDCGVAFIPMTSHDENYSQHDTQLMHALILASSGALVMSQNLRILSLSVMYSEHVRYKYHIPD